jgi:hypothetical protein
LRIKLALERGQLQNLELEKWKIEKLVLGTCQLKISALEIGRNENINSRDCKKTKSQCWKREEGIFLALKRKEWESWRWKKREVWEGWGEEQGNKNKRQRPIF